MNKYSIAIMIVFSHTDTKLDTDKYYLNPVQLLKLKGKTLLNFI